MNVVGKVGSLISQGVYSVATPFHPFGGAVDVIVVQQQDGTFRSTPWYVRFGKFQGVLQGAEEIVKISVNGTEANFHMYLDKSGKAFFIHEIESTKDGAMHDESDYSDAFNEDDVDHIPVSIKNVTEESTFEHSISDSGIFSMEDQISPLHPRRIERTESDGNRRYYDFQDDQSSLEDTGEFSEFDSNRFGTVDDEKIRKSPDADSEVVLVSVDGHVLTAPVSSSEQNTDNIRLSTPQFHLGPIEGEEEFDSSDGAWTTGYIDDCTTNPDPCKVLDHNNDKMVDGNQPKICEVNGEHAIMNAENKCFSDLLVDSQLQGDSDEATCMIKEDDIFKSCHELSGPSGNVGLADSSKMTVQVPVQSLDDDVSCSAPGNVLESEKTQSSPSFSDISRLKGECVEYQNTPDSSKGGSIMSISMIAEEETLQDRKDEDHLQETGNLAPKQTISQIDISVCGKDLFAGMGLDAAEKAFESRRIFLEDFKDSPISITNDENLIIRYEGKYFSWQQASPLVLGIAVFGLHLPIQSENAIPVDEDRASSARDEENGMNPASVSRKWRLWPIPFRRIKSLEHTDNNSSSEEYFVDTESTVSHSNLESISTPQGGAESPKKQLRTNVPTSDQIASLNLKDGQNLITFNFSTRVLGKQQVEAHLYLWKWNARIVISDVDGTITKSDVLGQFMPLVGKDWSQSGVAKLFSAIKENGYQLLFLSARAIVQAYLTRSFLFNLKQDGKTLPNGPVVISPDGLFPSLYREVIRRAPHEFKIACLEDIRRLFPPDYNPFYAGFGNRDTDELSYRKIGIPKGKVFIINPKGEVAVSHCIDVKSYTSLHTLVNDMFPPTSLVEQEDYNAWNFWKVPLPEIDL